MTKKKTQTPEAPAPAQKKARKPASKKKTTRDYIEELKQMIEMRTGRPFELWLTPQLRATAMNLVVLDRVQENLEKENVSASMTGSMGQQKIESNPLFVTYDKIQRTLLSQFEALGLSYTSKIKDQDGNGDKPSDPMAKLYEQAQQALDDN